MTTFSQLVDSVIVESRRPDLRAIIESQLNLTVRELHMDSKTRMTLRYGANLTEVSILAQAQNGYVWKIPEAHLFQNLEAIYYPNRGVIPKQRNPGSAMAYLDNPDGQYYFYRSGDNYVFAGYGGENEPIYVAYYKRLKRLVYKPPADRLVQWNEEDQIWVFNESIAGDPVLEEDALSKETHWMLQRWPDLLGQGVRAKLYARLADESRARIAYSLYEELRPGMVSAESYEFVPTWNR